MSTTVVMKSIQNIYFKISTRVFHPMADAFGLVDVRITRVQIIEVLLYSAQGALATKSIQCKRGERFEERRKLWTPKELANRRIHFQNLLGNPFD